MNNIQLIPSARDWALREHAHIIITTVSGLKRPQILHLQEVANLVWSSGGSEEEIAAAWLHDIVEDTPVTLEEIANNFGESVAAIVDGLTDPPHFKAMHLSERKPKQAERLRAKGPSVKRVKIADQISNLHSLILDPIASMTPVECKYYFEGAKLIAQECMNISPLLDALLEDVYQKGREKYP